MGQMMMTHTREAGDHDLPSCMQRGSIEDCFSDSDGGGGNRLERLERDFKAWQHGYATGVSKDVDGNDVITYADGSTETTSRGSDYSSDETLERPPAAPLRNCLLAFSQVRFPSLRACSKE